ncbi:aminoacyltransferase, partial [Streptococcus agalactiae]|nr:aminoacyltransferase [Streptococcus agalactiae]
MYREITAVEHDRFVSESNQTNLLQSSNWPKVKDNWGSQLLGFFDGETQIASASILIKSLPLGFSMLYIPRGPIMDYSNLDIVTKVLKDLKAFGKKQRALFIKCDPLIYLKMVNAKDFENSPDEKEGLIAIDHLQRAGADWTGRTTDLAHTIQPRFQANLYANQFGLDKMSKKTRQAIRTSKNKGVDIQFGSHELLEDFAELMKKTEDRKGINLRGIDYYQKLLDTYPNNSYITMASLDVAKRLEKIEKECQIAQSERIKSLELNREKKVKQHQGTIDRLNKEIDFLKEAQKAYDRDIIPLAATLTLE